MPKLTTKARQCSLYITASELPCSLFNLSAMVERKGVELFQRNYSELVDQARTRLTGVE